MSVEASRIERVEVNFKMTEATAGGDATTRHTVTEAEARDLMHALADSLGYDAVKRV